MSILGVAVAAMSKPFPTKGEGSLRSASFGPHLIDWVQWTLLTRPWCGGLFFERLSWGGGVNSKTALREQLSAKRRAMSSDLIDARGLKVQSRFLATPYYSEARVVALYAPIRGEVPTNDILAAALADGKTVCYPLSHVHGRVLSFRAI